MKVRFACLFMCFGLMGLSCSGDGTNLLNPQAGKGGGLVADDEDLLSDWDPLGTGGYTTGSVLGSTSSSGGAPPDESCHEHGNGNGKGKGQGNGKGHRKDCE
jgi:hypothetical protein